MIAIGRMASEEPLGCSSAAPAPDERGAPPTLELAQIAQVYDHARWYAAITPPHVRAEAVRLLKLTIEALENVNEE